MSQHSNRHQATSPLKLVVLISGGGTTLKNLLEQITAKKLDAAVELVISSSPAAKGIQLAETDGIATAILERKPFDSVDAYSEAIFNRCRAASPDYVVMGGFLKLVARCPRKLLAAIGISDRI